MLYYSWKIDEKCQESAAQFSQIIYKNDGWLCFDCMPKGNCSPFRYSCLQFERKYIRKRKNDRHVGGNVEWPRVIVENDRLHPPMMTSKSTDVQLCRSKVPYCHIQLIDGSLGRYRVHSSHHILEFLIHHASISLVLFRNMGTVANITAFQFYS